jgi:hypothetical protein
MNVYAGWIAEFHLEADGRHAPRITCPPKAIPAAGQYLLAHSPADPDALLGAVLIPRQILGDGFVAAPPAPPGWSLGAPLKVRGPLGRGFRLPARLSRLALAAFGDTAARLLPLLSAADSVALFTDLPAPQLPTHVEIQPLASLPDALSWADFVAADTPLERLADLASLTLTARPVQALIATPMPCGGLGECGVCAVKARRGWRLACKDGPVFALNELALA